MERYFRLFFLIAILSAGCTSEEESAITPDVHITDSDHKHYHIHAVDASHEHGHKNSEFGGHSHRHEHADEED